ncbi:MAG: hypothetical protein ACO27T_03670 [Candidatus Limnocylindrus sp.]
MQRSALFSFVLFTLLTAQLAFPDTVRGEERAPLLLSEILTGGATAVDEYVRIEASGALPIDLIDIELVYISASGLTTRRLVSLAAVGRLMPGDSLLFAHSLGQYSASARLTWSDGISSSGGVLQLRRVGTTPDVLDAVAWGSATLTAGGEGLPVLVSSAGTPFMRARSTTGALIDSNMNREDFAAQVPPTISPTASPLPTPLPTPTLSPTPTPSSTPPPAALAVGEARAAQIGTQVRVRGVITALPGELAEPLLAAIHDPLDGSGLFVLVPPTFAGLMRGQLVEMSGLLTLRRQTLTLVATAAPLLAGSASPPLPLAVKRPAVGAWAWEAWEGRRIRVEGVLAGSPSSLADGAVSLRLRLSSGEELLAAASSSVALTLPAALQEAGRRVRMEGLIHQRGSVSGGGYRLWLDPHIGLALAPLPPSGEAETGAADEATARVVPNPLPLGTPTIAVPLGAERGWLREIVTSLRVDEGRLELWRDGVVRLVVLPSCGEPVDHEGAAPYPNPR